MKLHVKSASFSTHNGKNQCCQFFYCISNHKTSSQTISITLLQISLKLHEHLGGHWRKKLLWRILEEQFPAPRYTAASKKGNSINSLLWQLRCRCNPDHDKFSSLSNTTVVAIFPKLCLWRRSLCSNLGGIHPEKLYRATLNDPSHAKLQKYQDGRSHVQTCTWGEGKEGEGTKVGRTCPCYPHSQGLLSMDGYVLLVSFWTGSLDDWRWAVYMCGTVKPC